MIDLKVCYYCHVTLDDYSRTVDHLTPKSRGGIRSNKNKVPSCRECNQLKSNMDIEEFKRAINSMIYLKTIEYKKSTNYLKKVLKNISK